MDIYHIQVTIPVQVSGDDVVTGRTRIQGVRWIKTAVTSAQQQADVPSGQGDQHI